MAHIQTSALVEGTTSASVTLTGVAAHSRIVVFAGVGSTSAPSTHSVSDGTSYTAIGSPAVDSGDAVWIQAYELLDAASGSHTITFTGDIGAATFIIAVECSAPTTGASNVNSAFQASPGTGTNAISSGSVTSSGNDTLICFCTDSGNNAAGSIPAVGTSFISHGSGQPTSIGSWRISTRSITVNTAATCTAQSGTDGAEAHCTLGVAVAEPVTAVDQIYPECGDWMEAAAIGEAEIHDVGPWDWYQDNTCPNRAGVEPPIPERLPESFEWVDPNETDEALYQWPLAHAPPPADIDTYVYDGTIHDSSTQLEDVDEDFAFAADPLAGGLAPDQIWPEDASTQLEDVDEDFAFADAPRAADVIVLADIIAPELGNDQPDENEFAEGFSGDPLPDDVIVTHQLFNEFGHFDDPTDEPVDEGFFAAPMVAEDSLGDQECPQPQDEDDAPEGFAANPLAADNDVSAPCVTPDQADEPEDEPFSFDAQPQADDVQSDQVFTESGDWWPDDVVEEPEGFTCDPAVPELVIEEPLPFCDFPAQAEEPEDEDFGFSDFQTPDDVVPAPVTTQVVGSGGKGKKRKQASTGPSYADQFKDELAQLREAEALRERIAQEDEEILALVAGFISVITR